MLKTLYNGINTQNLKNVALQHYKSSCRQNVRNPIFATPLLTPGLESVGPCGPLGHLSGDLSSQVREKGHLDTGAGINVALPVLPKNKRKHLKIPPPPDFSHQSFNPLTQHCFANDHRRLQ